MIKYFEHKKDFLNVCFTKNFAYRVVTSNLKNMMGGVSRYEKQTYNFKPNKLCSYFAAFVPD